MTIVPYLITSRSLCECIHLRLTNLPGCFSSVCMPTHSRHRYLSTRHRKYYGGLKLSSSAGLGGINSDILKSTKHYIKPLFVSHTLAILVIQHPSIKPENGKGRSNLEARWQIIFTQRPGYFAHQHHMQNSRARHLPQCPLFSWS